MSSLSLTDTHDHAMEFVDQAFFARRRGDSNTAQNYLREAYNLERQAAEHLRNSLESEPSRSILYRSAASLALDCGLTEEAERLAATGLAGNPPLDIAEELRDLMENINFKRHLTLRNIDLAPGEVQLSIAGSAVAHGMARLHEFVDRVATFERMIYRNVERITGQPFRERGSAVRSVTEAYSVFIAAPRAGSFSVTLRLGRQLQFPELDQAPQVLEDILENVNLLEHGQEQALHERIPNEAYYRNFVQLARKLAPDGDDVKLVGLTLVRNGQEHQAKLTRKQQEIATGTGNGVASGFQDRRQKKVFQIIGRLSVADGRKIEGKIKLIDDQGGEHPIFVPEGMLNDIVRPLWDDKVAVTATKKKGKMMLETIDRAD